ncbi:MAG: hypothetical protein BWY02_02779 [bacterium ADurb.Bin157]|nr:MAG: hypothetical protein BWY02_02779 [bacterium ADurb.Bin157]
MNEIKIMKFIAPKIISINGHPAPCECTDEITCAYCVQASLIGYDKKLKDNDEIKKKLVTQIKRRGIRKVAREINAQASSVQYWFKTENFPQWVLNKYAGCTNENTNTQGA